MNDETPPIGIVEVLAYFNRRFGVLGKHSEENAERHSHQEGQCKGVTAGETAPLSPANWNTSGLELQCPNFDPCLYEDEPEPLDMDEPLRMDREREMVEEARERDRNA